MELHTQGSYSKVFMHDSLVIKLVSPQLDPSSLAERCHTIQQYYTLLLQAGVSIPETKILSMGAYLLIIMDRAPGENAFQQALKLGAVGDSVALYALFNSCCDQVVKLIGALHTEWPVGYDASPENFVVDPDMMEAMCIDIYPPRLGFKINEQGSVHRPPPDELLVDYTHGGRTTVERWSALRRAFYDPAGMVEHFLVWFAACGVQHSCSETLENATALLDNLSKLAIEKLWVANLGGDAQAVGEALAETHRIRDALSYRLSRVADRLMERNDHDCYCACRRTRESYGRSGSGCPQTTLVCGRTPNVYWTL